MKTSVHVWFWLAAIAVAGLIGAGPLWAGTIYVSKAGNDAYNGLSWGTAKLTVQAGLNAAASGNQVWVAAGTYAQCITLKTGLALYGGFAGTETDLSQRDWVTNVTILDGNQAGSVVTVPDGAPAATRIDGFTIRNGNASSGGGISSVALSGSSPTIANNTITANTAGIVGGGIYVGGLGSPTIVNNMIAGNSAVSGGGIGVASGGSPIVANDTIVNNTGSAGGGAIYCTGSVGWAVTNTIIAHNSSGIQGTAPSLRCRLRVRKPQVRLFGLDRSDRGRRQHLGGPRVRGPASREPAHPAGLALRRCRG